MAGRWRSRVRERVASMRAVLIGARVQRIAFRADGANDLLPRAERYAQPPDQYVDSPQLDFLIMRPHDVEELLTGIDAFRGSQQMLQEPVFGGTKRDGPPVAAHTMCGNVQFDAAV